MTMAASRRFWDYVMGPGYNKRVLRIGREFYRPFVDMVVEGSEMPQPAKVLDVGSGPGLVTLLLAEEYPLAQVVGVDFSSRQVRAANHLLSHEPIDNCSFRVGNAVQLPFESDSFGMVVSTFSISCWPDIRKSLGEIRRVLVSGGEAFIVDADSSASEEEVRMFVQGYAAGGACRYLQAWFTRKYVFGQAIAITYRRAEELARDAGFGSIKAEKKPGLPFFRLILRK
jgi:ubiquinone/menaquinone biosynthesis C-methylase UbiE